MNGKITRWTLFLISTLFFSFNLEAQQLNPKLTDFVYLLGTYDLTIYVPAGEDNWQEAGKGNASFTTILDGTFIQEDFFTTMGNTTLTMKNTIGVDARTEGLRLIAMDKEYGTMDVYEGEKEGDVITVSNITSDRPFVNDQGEAIAFRLTYSKVDAETNQLLVEFTKNKGETWMPYAKQVYRKKK